MGEEAERKKGEEGENACVNLLSQKGRGSSELGLDKTIGR